MLVHVKMTLLLEERIKAKIFSHCIRSPSPIDVVRWGKKRKTFDQTLPYDM